MRRITAAIMAIAIALPALSQEVRHYMPSDGLSGIDVSSVCETEYFLWVATNDGLCRFDGKNFRVYRSSDRRNDLTSNNIEVIMTDSAGRLWIGLKTGGVDIFNPRTEEFTSIADVIGDFPQRVISIYEDSRHDIWLGTWEEGVWQLIPKKKGGKETFDIVRHYDRNIVSSIIERPQGKLWIGTYYGLFLYDMAAGRDIPIGDNHFSVTQILDTGEEGSLVFSSWTEGLSRISWDADFDVSFDPAVSHKDGNVYCLAPSSQGKYYLGTWGEGIRVSDLSSGTEGEPPFKINAPVVQCFFRDRNKRLWIGTYGTGLFCVEDTPGGVSNIPSVCHNDSAIYAMEDLSNGEVLIGSQGEGLFIYDAGKKEETRVSSGRGQSFFSKNILSIYKDDDLLLVGNDDNGLLYSSSGNVSRNIKWDTFLIDKNFGKITAIFRDYGGRFWLGTKQNGVYSCLFKDGKFTDVRRSELFGTDEITGFIQKDPGHLWVSTHRGIYLFDESKDSVDYVQNTDIIYKMCKGRDDGTIWLGTSNGLRRLEVGDSIRIEEPTFDKMLPNGAIRDLCIDDGGNLWFSVSNGIFCYKQDADVLKQIQLGNNYSELYYSAAPIKYDGITYICFGGTDNLLAVNPELALNQPDDTKIILTELQLDHQKVDVGQKIHGTVILREAPEYVGSITIPRTCKWIGLSFTEYASNSYNSYFEYNVDGFSDKWQYLDVSKPLSFSQLPSGEYSLNIRSMSGGADLKAPILTLKLIIPKPWWKTNLFYAGLVLFILLSLFVMWRIIRDHYRKRQAEYQEELKKQEDEALLKEKEDFFTQMSHDLMTPLSLVIAPVKDMLREESTLPDQREKLSIVSRNAEFLSNLFSSILDFKRTELSADSSCERNVEIVSFVKVVSNAFDYSMRDKDISLTVVSDVASLDASIDTVKLERILYNIIGNAIKYTGDGGKIGVSIRHYADGGKFSIAITDNGVGIEGDNLKRIFDKFYRADRKDERKGLGLGLYTSLRFAKTMGGDISVDSECGNGTTFIVTLPLKSPQTPAVPDSDAQDTDFGILIVEDNVEMREYLRKKISSKFYVAVASDGQEALEYIKANLPEIVISDVMMPKMDGLALCSEIKSMPDSSDIFVILLSAKTSIEDEINGYKSGADFYMKKPFDPDMLLNQISNVYNTARNARSQTISGLMSPQSAEEFNPKNEFVGKAIKVADDNLSNELFCTDDFARELNLSKTVLHRKFKLYIGDSPNNFIKRLRLKKAAEMLLSTGLTVSEIAYTNGFSQAHYFIKCFKELYGVTPKKYRENR